MILGKRVVQTELLKLSKRPFMRRFLLTKHQAWTNYLFIELLESRLAHKIGTVS